MKCWPPVTRACQDVANVQTLVGHGSTAVTIRVYWHAEADGLAEGWAQEDTGHGGENEHEDGDEGDEDQPER